MTPLTPEQVAELRRLWEQSTQGHWKAMADGTQYLETTYLPTAKPVVCARIEELPRPWNPHAYVAFGFKPKEFETSRFVEADADWIAAAHNHFEALLAAAEREQRLRELLQKICDMQKQNYGHGIETHLGLIALAEQARVLLNTAKEPADAH